MFYFKLFNIFLQILARFAVFDKKDDSSDGKTNLQ